VNRAKELLLRSRACSPKVLYEPITIMTNDLPQTGHFVRRGRTVVARAVPGKMKTDNTKNNARRGILHDTVTSSSFNFLVG
jgi:hypothetical protein